ncbi:MAG: amidase [Xanthobacteraceae bacterium]|nr:amidase [Xanthobacteraceae bacterium]
MTAPDTMTPVLRPYLPASRNFAAGEDSPREFLERCLAALDAWEPRIGAFVTLDIEGARAEADRSSARWREGHPLSPIDGMPLGIKDIIETADMPTENGSPLFAGFRSERDAASVMALREAGAVILGKTVTTEFAATEPRGTRNPWDPARTPGGSSSGSAAAVGAGIIPVGLGTQVIGSTLRPASFCGCYGFKPTIGALNRGGSYDGLSQSCTGTLAASLEEAWQVAYEIVKRAGGDPGFPGLYGPPHPPEPVKPRRLAFLRTDGWAEASPAAAQSLEDALARLRGAGVAILGREDNAAVAAAETAVHQARDLSFDINAWESRWPINTYSRRDASKLSQAMRDRLVQAEAMTLDNYRAMLKERRMRRDIYAGLAGECDACITLAATGAAPPGLGSTGNPVFVVPASLLGIPAISLPVLSDAGLPLGLQLMGFADQDAALFSFAAGVLTLLG